MYSNNSLFAFHLFFAVGFCKITVQHAAFPQDCREGGYERASKYMKLSSEPIPKKFIFEAISNSKVFVLTPKSYIKYEYNSVFIHLKAM